MQRRSHMANGPVPHILLFMLVLALALADAAMARQVALRNLEWPEPLCVIGLGAIFAQVCLLACWLSWGRQNIAIRLAVGLAAAFGLAVPTSEFAIDPPRLWFAGLLGILSIASVLLWLVKLGGMRLVFADRPLHPASPRWQTSIGGLLSVTTGLACVLGTIRHLRFPTDAGVATWGLFAILTALAALILFAVLAARHFWFPLAVISVSLPVSVWFADMVAGRKDTWETTLLLFVVHGCVVAGGAAVIRVAGGQLQTARGLERGLELSGSDNSRYNSDCHIAS